MFDHLRRLLVHPDAGPLRCPRSTLERLLRPAPLLGHEDALSLVNRRLDFRPGLPPGRTPTSARPPAGTGPEDLLRGCLRGFWCLLPGASGRETP
jgi:hypothetical protein